MSTTENMVSDPYLTTQQAADYLGYSAQTLRRARVDGEKLNGREGPKFYGSRRSTRYKKSDLDAWIEQQN